MEYKGVIFDFNGTLFWDSKLHLEAWREFSKRLRDHAFTDEEMRDYMFGRTNEDIIAYLIGKRPSAAMVNEFAEEKEAVYRKMCLENPAEFHLAPYAVDFLNYLKKNNIPRTIATMSNWSNVEFFIKEFKLSQWFDLEKIVYDNGKIPGKPAPDIYLIAAEKLCLQPQDCVVIEDAVSGIEAARAAGIGKITAIASMEPVELYKNIQAVSQIITDFKGFETSWDKQESLIK